mmetsp:Transcript_13773/g.47912  ORF Transcript_13773/g.47912 Transcript_13773/m.47912 type:complete len:227 (-) Transcript_13773:176-856(-)
MPLLDRARREWPPFSAALVQKLQKRLLADAVEPRERKLLQSWFRALVEDESWLAGAGTGTRVRGGLWDAMFDAATTSPSAAARAAAAAAAAAGLELQERVEHGERFVHCAGNVGVVVHAEDPGPRRQRQRLDVVHVRLVRRIRVRVDGLVDALRVEGGPGHKDARVVKRLDDHVDGADIDVVRHAAAVVALADAVLESLEGHRVVLLDERVELLHRDQQVRLVEAV